MASFWRENQLVQTKKKLKGSSWFGESKGKLGSKVAHFFILGFFLPLLFKFCEMENMLWIDDIVESTPTSPHF
jgi:hypothetical protein